MNNPFRRKKPYNYSCYWIALHFPSSEAAAGFTNRLGDLMREAGAVRMLRGGETIPRCPADDPTVEAD